MKVVRIASVIVVLLGIVALSIVIGPSIYGQSRRSDDPRPFTSRPGFEPFAMLEGPGSRIGATVRDLEASESGAGVYVEDVRTDGPAAKAGIQRADIITKWDGETVRSVRQFTRLVRETPPDRAVATTITRAGKSTDLKVTPENFRDADQFSADINRQVQEQLGRLRERMDRVPFDFNFDFDFDQALMGGARLGITINPLTPQLATYFGAKDGVLVASVADDSPASRAGLKAGDVITTIDGQGVASRGDLARALRNARADAAVTIGIVRDKKETSVKAKLDDARTRRTTRSRRISA